MTDEKRAVETLPFGLYQVVRLPETPEQIHHAITYRHSDVGGWMHAINNERLTEREKRVLQDHLDNDELVRLVHEKR